MSEELFILIYLGMLMAFVGFVLYAVEARIDRTDRRIRRAASEPLWKVERGPAGKK